MKVKKLLAGVLSAAMVLGTVAIPTFADSTDTMTYGDFLDKLVESGYNYDGKNATVTLTTNFGCTQNHDCLKGYATATAETPSRIMDQQKRAQYHLFSGETQDIVIKNVKFVADIKGGAGLCIGSDWGKDSFAAGSDFYVELQFEHKGNLTIDGCEFDNISVSGIHSGDNKPDYTDTVTNSKFKNVYNGYGVATVNGGKVIASGNTFDNCAGGIYIQDGGANGIVLDGNTFTNIDNNCLAGNVGTKGMIQLSAAVPSTSQVIIVNNNFDNSTKVLRQLSSVAEITAAGNTFATEDGFTYIDGGKTVTFKTPVAVAGTTAYDSLADALQAATNNDTVTLFADTEATFPCQRYITNAKVLDLNGKKLTLNGYDFYWGEMTFKNGTIDITADYFDGTAIFWQVENKEHLTFDDVTVNANSLEGCYLIGNNGGADTVITLNNSTINSQSDAQRSLAAIFGLNGNCKLVVNNSKVNVSNIGGHVIYQGNTEIKGDKSEINANKVGSGVFLNPGSILTVSDSAVFNITDVIGDDDWNSEKASIVFYDGNGTFQAKSGKYSMDVSAYCESGYTAAKIGDMYEVLEKTTTPSDNYTNKTDEIITEDNKATLTEKIDASFGKKENTTSKSEVFSFSKISAKVLRATYTINDTPINADIVVKGLEVDGDLTLGIILYNIPADATVTGPEFSTLQ